MRRIRFPLALALVVAAACARASAPGEPAAPAPAPARGDSKTVTETELALATQLNLYDYVLAERPRWIRNPGTAGRGQLAVVTVYLDDARLGEVQTLKTLSVNTVRLIRYYEASAAQQKFSTRDYGPVIHVISK